MTDIDGKMITIFIRSSILNNNGSKDDEWLIIAKIHVFYLNNKHVAEWWLMARGCLAKDD